MSKNKLGRGLSALLPERNTAVVSNSELQTVSVDKIKTHPYVKTRVCFYLNRIYVLKF